MNLRSGLQGLDVVARASTAILLTATLLAAGAANADVTFTAMGEILTGANAGSTDTTLATAGDQVQIDIFMVNDAAIAGASFTAGVPGSFNTGTDSLQLDGGLTSAVWFNTGLNKFGGPQGGAPNGDGTDNGVDGAYTSIAIPRSLDASDITLNGNLRFFSAFLVNVNGSGEFDMGILDGSTGPGGTPDIGLGSAGAAHVRLVFTVIGGGALLTIGNNAPDDSLTPQPGASNIITPTSIQVPEPGSLTLGLSAMASVFAVVGIRRRTS